MPQRAHRVNGDASHHDCHGDQPGTPEAVAMTAMPIRNASPARRVARPATAPPLIPRLVRICRNTTITVLTAIARPTNHRGASVCRTTHNGRAYDSTSLWIHMMPSSTTNATYGLSLSAIHRPSSRGDGRGFELGQLDQDGGTAYERQHASEDEGVVGEVAVDLHYRTGRQRAERAGEHGHRPQVRPELRHLVTAETADHRATSRTTGRAGEVCHGHGHGQREREEQVGEQQRRHGQGLDQQSDQKDIPRTTTVGEMPYRDTGDQTTTPATLRAHQHAAGAPQKGAQSANRPTMPSAGPAVG